MKSIAGESAKQKTEILDHFSRRGKEAKIWVRIFSYSRLKPCYRYSIPGNTWGHKCAPFHYWFMFSTLGACDIVKGIYLYRLPSRQYLHTYTHKNGRANQKKPTTNMVKRVDMASFSMQKSAIQKIQPKRKFSSRWCDEYPYVLIRTHM